jgi:hypothetical protein
MAKAHLTKDEYNWKVYTKEYSAQVDEMQKTAGDNGSDFLIKSWEKTDNGVVFHDKLHGNWKGIYTAIYEKNPKTVFECGCGGMYHLKNIKTLFPDIEVFGCDLLKSQIDFGAKKFEIENDILKNVKILDFAAPEATNELSQYDFVYSQAVMMHLSREKCLRFFKNMLDISKEHVFFVEGQQHDYQELLEAIGEDKNWDVTRPKTHNSWQLKRVER